MLASFHRKSGGLIGGLKTPPIQFEGNCVSGWKIVMDRVMQGKRLPSRLNFQAENTGMILFDYNTPLARI